MAKKISMGSMTELFNAASTAEKSSSFKVEMIDIDDIIPNEQNEYSITQIDELALDISFVGVRQNLEVTPIGNGKYKLISGERRYTAVKKLVTEEGREDLRKVPCRVTEPKTNINLDIPEDIKELWLLTTTNKTREKTDADILTDIRNQKIIYKALLDSGVELRGRQRDIIAAALEISPSQVQRYEYVDKNLTPELKEGFEANKIPLTVAVEAAKQPEPVQKKLAQKIKQSGELTQADVDTEKKKAEKKEKKAEAKAEYDTYIISKKDFDYLSALNITLKAIEEGTVVSGKDYNKLLSAREKIIKQQTVINDIITAAQKKNE